MNLNKQIKGSLIVTSPGRKQTAYYKNTFHENDFIVIDEEPKIENINSIYNKMLVKDTPKKIIALGGGSVLDSAKILGLSISNKISPKDCIKNAVYKKLEKNIKLIAVPTTYGSGSEATNISVYKEDGIKRSIKDNNLYFDEVYILEKRYPDVRSSISYSFLADAASHALESFYSNKATDVSKLFSVSALTLLINSRNKTDYALASFFAGIAETNAGVGLIHALAYPIQNFNQIAHSTANALVLSTVNKFNLFGDRTYKKLVKYNISNTALLGFLDRICSHIDQTRFDTEDISQYVKNYKEYKHLINNSDVVLSHSDVANLYTYLINKK